MKGYSEELPDSYPYGYLVHRHGGWNYWLLYRTITDAHRGAAAFKYRTQDPLFSITSPPRLKS